MLSATPSITAKSAVGISIKAIAGNSEEDDMLLLGTCLANPHAEDMAMADPDE